MIALTTIETSVLDIAHLVGVAAVEHLVDEPLIVGRIVARMELFKPLPVIDKDLFEDVPVPRRLDDHQITPSEGDRCWGCGMFTTSHPLRPPLIGVHQDMRIHLPRPGVMRASGSRKMKNPIRLNYKGVPISDRGISKLVVKYRKNAGITKRASCHSLRHTFATYKAEKGVSPFQLQQWLGHANLNTTQIYVHLGKQNAKKIMEQTSLP